MCRVTICLSPCPPTVLRGLERLGWMFGQAPPGLAQRLSVCWPFRPSVDSQASAFLQNSFPRATTVRYKGRNLRIKAPMCRALKKLCDPDGRWMGTSRTRGGACGVPFSGGQAELQRHCHSCFVSDPA